MSNESSKQKRYRPIETRDEEYILARPTLKRIEKHNELAVRSVTTSEEDRASTCEQMGWDPKDFEGERLSYRQFFEAVAELIFLHFSLGDEADDLDVGVVQEANRDFLLKAVGVSPRD